MSRISDLQAKILDARTAYYNTDTPLASDRVFDAWVDELKILDPTNKAITMVGAPLIPSEWKKAKHQIPMGSLDKINRPEELVKWIEEVYPDGKLLVCEKLDGLSIEVIYEEGRFIQAITRGSDGIEGEDITVNVVKMGGVKSHLKHNFTGSLRGEIIMFKTIHKLWFPEKANPRNAASGVSKRLDGVGVDKLSILFYQVLGDVDFKNEQSQFVWLKNQGLNTPNWWIVKTAEEVNRHWRKYQDENRDKLDYDIDGLVVRIDDMAKQMSLGDKDMRPKGAIAFKFDNVSREGFVSKIVIQCGNSGRLTPVAVFDPKVPLMGAEIEKASLHNFANIASLGLDIGATVLVCRANDVIPFVEEVVKSTGTIFAPPTHCPECNSPVIEVGEYVQCPNVSQCPAQIVGRIKNWVKELNLLEWGDTLIEKLVEAGKVETVADLYTLTVDDLADLDRMGEKSAQKCYDILWANNEVSLEVFLGGLSIPMIGQSTIKLIMDAGCDTLEKFGQLNATEFEKVAGVGPVKAESLATGLQENQQLILSLLTNGVKVKEKIIGKLSGKSFAITGTLSMKRAEIESLITQNGGEVKSSVGKNTTYLIISDVNSTSSKAQAARKNGTILLSESDLFAMLS